VEFVRKSCRLIAALEREDATDLERFRHAHQNLGASCAASDTWPVEQKDTRRRAFTQSIQSLD
jgi:hypothetical protein